ncbi:hypothetical protein RIB2604_01711970 [Aspergillus luchuensis]|uniref:Uncharacterized protein n=1 Tax=Aspergillus kawachii TaxID=1069201 RepID=A0A146FCW3_ASPKA|nr:hypothetical protein RIB2604_01711970 [Aspergillus luchuensis]
MKFSVLFTALFAALVTAQHAKGGGGVSAHGKRQTAAASVAAKGSLETIAWRTVTTICSMKYATMFSEIQQ